MFRQRVLGHAKKPTTQGVQYNEECRFSIKTNVELLSIYLGIWPHYIGNSHTNERDLSAGIDRLSRANFGIPAEPRLATLSTACNCTPPPGWAKSIFATI